MGLLLLALPCGCDVPDASVREPSAAASVDVRELDLTTQLQAIQDGHSQRLEVLRPLTRAEWAMLPGLARLNELVLEGGGFDEEQAAFVASLPELKKLVIRHAAVSDAAFFQLAGCRSLRELNIPQAGCTAAGIAALAALPELRSLRIGGRLLAGADVCEAVVTLKKLRFLHLVEVPVTDAGLAVLQQRPDLWSLYLDRAGVSDEAWGRYFQACPNVHVHVDQAHHDRDPGGDREQHETGSPPVPGASVQQQ